MLLDLLLLIDVNEIDEEIVGVFRRMAGFLTAVKTGLAHSLMSVPLFGGPVQVVWPGCGSGEISLRRHEDFLDKTGCLCFLFILHRIVCNDILFIGILFDGFPLKVSQRLSVHQSFLRDRLAHFVLLLKKSPSILSSCFDICFLKFSVIFGGDISLRISKSLVQQVTSAYFLFNEAGSC